VTEDKVDLRPDPRLSTCRPRAGTTTSTIHVDEGPETVSEPAVAQSVVALPWRAGELDGFNSSYGPTYNGGGFSGGGPSRNRSLSVRVLTPMGEPSTVSIDLCDDSRLSHSGHGCTVTLDPATARAAAAALLAGAEKAEGEMAHWRGVLDQQRAEQRAEIQAMQLRDAAGRAGVPAE
jgi:hypothetical protein